VTTMPTLTGSRSYQGVTAAPPVPSSRSNATDDGSTRHHGGTPDRGRCAGSRVGLAHDLTARIASSIGKYGSR
jgi:hypothetical protein